MEGRGDRRGLALPHPGLPRAVTLAIGAPVGEAARFFFGGGN